MNNGVTGATHSDETERRADRFLRESLASAGRIALSVPNRSEHSDPRSGGDPSKAPTSLSAAELHPIEGDSSGTSWDDPEEL